MRIAEFLPLMPYLVTVEACSTMDTYGNRTYQTCATYRAAIQGPSKFFYTQENSERVSSQTLYIGSAVAIRSTDRITLPSPFDITAPTILQTQIESDMNGPAYTKVFLGGARRGA